MIARRPVCGHIFGVGTVCALVLLASARAIPAAESQSYPVRPIRLIAPSTAGGGGVDLYARLIGKKLTDAWGQQVIVDNRPGGGMSLGATVVRSEEHTSELQSH